MDKPTPKAKACSKCGKRLSLEKFGKDRSRKDGAFPWCKTCVSVDKKRRYKSNPQPAKDRAKKWANENPERYKERVKSWHAANKDRLKTYREKPTAKYKNKIRVSRYRSKPSVAAKTKAYAKDKWAEEINSLSDGYVASTICAHASGLNRSDVPPELIEAKRIQLQIKRYLKNGN